MPMAGKFHSNLASNRCLHGIPSSCDYRIWLKTADHALYRPRLPDEMEVAARPMEAIGKQMETLGSQIEREASLADHSIRREIDFAVQRGLAIPAPNRQSTHECGLGTVARNAAILLRMQCNQ